jgi:hypothetical protein
MLKRANILLGLAILLACVPAFAPRVLAQRGGMGMGMMPPSMNGLWNPVVGSGVAYEQTTKDGAKHVLTMAVISKEDSDGKPGYWMEFQTGDEGKQMISQMLMVKSSDTMSFAKVIVQQPGQPPMLISGAMMGMMAARGGSAPPAPKADVHDGAEVVGTESVTTPAGTFTCEHLRTKDGGNVWITPKLSPWGLVKSASPDGSTMVAIRVITDAKSHITGTPVPIEQMMGGRRGQN